MITTVEQALAASNTQEVRSVDETRAELAELSARVKATLSIEGDLIQELHRRQTEIEKEHFRAVMTERRGGENLPLLAPEVLSWRHPVRMKGIPVPKMILLDPTLSGTIRIPYPQFNQTLFRDIYPRVYADVIAAVNRKERSYDGPFPWSRRRTNVRLEFTFRGVIPQEARDIIRRERDASNFSNVLLLADAPLDAWTYREEKETREERRARVGDPLILGHENGRFWILGKFDPTPVEEYIANEFAS